MFVANRASGKSFSAWVAAALILGAIAACSTTPSGSGGSRIKSPPGPPRRQVSLTDAKAAAPFAVLVPSYFPKTGVTLTGVYQIAGSASDLQLEFSDGTMLSYSMRSETPDWANSSVVKSGRGTVLAYRGVSALAVEPGDQVIGGAPHHYKGTLEWIQGGVDYTLYTDYPVAELRKIADSLR